LVSSPENQLGGNSSTIIVNDDYKFPTKPFNKLIRIRGPGIPSGTKITDWTFGVSSTSAKNIINLSLSNSLDFGIPSGKCYETNSCSNYTYTYSILNAAP